MGAEKQARRLQSGGYLYGGEGWVRKGLSLNPLLWASPPQTHINPHCNQRGSSTVNVPDCENAGFLPFFCGEGRRSTTQDGTRQIFPLQPARASLANG